MAVILLFLSSLSTEAAEMCQAIFLPESGLISELQTLRKDLIEYRQSADALALRSKVIQQIAEVEIRVQKQLDDQGIRYQKTSTREPFLNLEWSHFRISTEGSHWLNKMAASLYKRTQTKLAFEPAQRAVGSFVASYETRTKTIVLPERTLFKKLPGDLEIHEIMHAYFHASREGFLAFMPKAPVHITFHSEKPIDPQAKSDAYQSYMTFEEIVNYAYNISYPARQSLKKVPTESDKKILSMRIDILLQVSRNAELASKLGLQYLQANKSMAFAIGAEKTLLLGRPGPLPYLEVAFNFKPENLSVEAYATRELQNALKLSQFNQKYFAEKDSWTLQQYFEKARDFRAEQKAFIEAL